MTAEFAVNELWQDKFECCSDGDCSRGPEYLLTLL